MENFVFTPAGVRDPMNHPHRIYFSCHSEDMPHFDFVSREIRKVEADCVIAYAAPAGDEAACIRELEGFHLTVIFVTENWFSEGRHRREFSYLTHEHKAILPILSDPALKERFNTATNNLQFLQINDPDFAEKLQRALQNILFDSQLLDKVSTVFTHKMFVSYCREDLDKARGLIRSVHSIEQGKRISIWYDKYLPMGKNFEESIFAELDDSQFFAVTLTPNLLGRENYVKKYEYPRAKTGNKQIIFFQLSPIDKRELHAQLTQSAEDDYICPDNTKELHSLIRRLIERTPGRSNEFEEAETDYLLGLAYQNGLFVEFDHGYAAKKLKTAANKNHADAAHTLANMYHYGLGIPRDQEKASSWYKKEVRIVEQEFLKEVEALQRLKTVPIVIWDPQKGLIPATDETMDTMQRTIDRVCGLMSELVVRCCNNGRTLRDDGRLKKAEQLYRIVLRSLDLIDSIANQLALGSKYRTGIENEMNTMLIVAGKHDHKNMKAAWFDCLQKYNRNPTEYLHIHGLLHSAHNYGVSLLAQESFAEARQVMFFALEQEAKACQAHILQEEDRPIYELVLVLHRDIGRTYIMEKPSSEEQREINAREAHRMFNRVRMLLKDIPFSIEDNPYLHFTLPWAILYTGDTYSYVSDHSKALEHYLLSYKEMRNTERALGDRAKAVDFPITLLEFYAVCLQKVSRYQSDGLQPILCAEIESLLQRYAPMDFAAEHAPKAKVYLGLLAETLESLSNV